MKEMVDYAVNSGAPTVLASSILGWVSLATIVGEHQRGRRFKHALLSFPGIAILQLIAMSCSTALQG